MREMEIAVEADKLIKVYEGKVKALDEVNLQVEAGKVFALLGPNGAGKTTLIRILTKQLTPTSGHASVFGMNVVHEGAKIRRIVSYVPQEMSVWTDISGFENLLIYAKIYGIPSDARHRVIDDMLESMGLREAKNSLVKTYSGGMIRRLEIACALLIRPKILFLDEPTIGLDPSARKVVWEKLTSFKKDYGATIFFNTHYMDEADLYSDEIAIINRGKLVKKGTAESLKHSIGGEVIIFGVEGNDVNEKVVSSVRALDLVKDVIAHESELSVVVDEAEMALPTVVNLLRGKGVPLKRISMTKPTLDDVFLKYAGTWLESGGRISDVRQVRRMIRRG
ncbi:MAG: ATP-binding cassette domain-containing protein [Nitrososphaeria archaeon]